jgi:hypothetical protein
MFGLQTSPPTYTEIWQRLARNVLLQAEVPVEYSVSLPLPTKRFGQDAYASFASPTQRGPGLPTVQGAPSRWWASDRFGRHLLIYALTAVQAFADTRWEAVTLPRVTRSIAELREEQSTIALLMDSATSAFFAGEPGEPRARRALWEALDVHIPAALVPQYQALAPDFFAWLYE